MVIIIDSFKASYLFYFTLYFMFHSFPLLPPIPFLPQGMQTIVFDVSLDIESILKNILCIHFSFT